MLKKLLFLLFAIGFSLFVIPLNVYADENFDILTDSMYQLNENGTTHVTQVVKIRNKTEYTYTPSYTITTGLNDLKNIKTFNSSGSLPNRVETTGEGDKKVDITFPFKSVGFGRINEFTISFDTKLITRKKGSIWEVSVPGLTDPSAFTEYNITLEVPWSFGPPTISKPYRELSAKGPYVFSKNEIGNSGILILFGKSQYYKLTLSYHIDNSRVMPIKTEIALPPDTSYQDILIEKISPPPQDAYQDEDGNWLAVYSLSPRERKSINVEALAHVFSSPSFELITPKGNLSSLRYWESTNPEIVKIANELKTPRKIYDYVVAKLTYNYDKISSKNVRLGAVSSLKRPDFSVCLEFTDLFIALARAAGIRARSVEGYAFTQDSKLRPLSLVQDILHSWPEYYDEEKKAWVMVDPTWGNTTQGMDYFNTFDFDHIAFVVKGKDSSYPVPAGGYKLNENTKDLAVEFTTEAAFRSIVKSGISANFPKYVFPFAAPGGRIILENKGNSAIKNKKLTVKSDLVPNLQEFAIDAIPPYGKKEINVGFEKAKLLTNQDYNITISYDGNSTTDKIRVGFFPDYYLLILGGVMILGSTAVSIATYKTWSIFVQKRKEQSNLRGKSPRS